jgi:fibronectin-binding autotransporter adhesin
MKTKLLRMVCAAAILAAAGLATRQSIADSTLFTTQEDWALWVNNGNIITNATSATSIDSSTTNGLGNNASPGGAGTNGSMQAVWSAQAYNFFGGPGEAGNQSFLSAIDPGAVAGTSTAFFTNKLVFDYTKPPPGTGNYFQLGLLLNYNGNFGQFFGTETDNGNGTFTATIPYTINPVSLTYFQLGLIYNSNYNTNTPFTIDNIRVLTPVASWNNSAGGSWGVASNWQPAIVPTGSGAIVTFGASPGLTADGTVTLDADRTVGHITFNNAGARYTIAQGLGGNLIIDNTAAGSTGVPDITVTAGNHTISAPVVIASGLTMKPAAGTSVTLSGGLSGTGPLVIADAGKVILTAASSHTGGTNINAGSLQIAGLTGAGTVTVASGGTLAGSGAINGLLNVQSGGAVDMRTTPSSIDTISPSGGFSLSDGTNLGFDIGNTADSIDVGGQAFTFSGTGKSTVFVGLASGFHNGDFNLISNAPGISLSEFQLGNAIPGFSSTLQISGSNLQVHLVSTAPATAFWHGGRVSGSASVWTALGSGGATNWDTAATGNIDSGVPSTPTTVHFSANAALAASQASTTLGADVTINALVIDSTNPVGIGGANTLTIATGGITVNGVGNALPNGGATTISSAVAIQSSQQWANFSTNKLAISGVVSGGSSAALTLAGTGTIALSGNNTYSGGTTINSTGTVQLGSATALGAGPVVQNSGTIDLHGFDVVMAKLSGTGLITNSAADPTLTINTFGTATYAGTIQNGNSTVAVTIGGAGTQILTGASTYTGGTTIAAGATLQLGDAVAATGSIVGNVIADGTLGFAGPANQVFNGTIGGAGNVSVSNPGTVTLSGNNSYAGTTTVSAGTLVAGSTSAFGTSNLTITAAGTVDLNGKNVTVSALNGTAVSNTNRAILTNNDPGTGTATLTVTNGGQFAGSITDGATAKTALKVSGGTLVLTSVSPDTYGGTKGVNTFTGGVTVLQGSTLQIGNFDGGNGQTVNPSPVLGGASGGPVTIGGGSSTAAVTFAWQAGGGGSNYFLPNAFNLNGNAALNGIEGNTHLTGPMAISGAGNTLSVTYYDKNIAFDGPISGSGTITARGTDGPGNQYSGGGKLLIATQVSVLGPVDNGGFTGTIALDETSALGTPSANFSGIQLVIADNAGLPNATVTMNGNYHAMANIGGNGVINVGYQGATGTIAFASGLPFNASATAPAIGALSSASGGDFQLSTSMAESVTLTLGKNNPTPVSFAGVISDGSVAGGSIIKVGSGTQILAGVNTYTGSTTVNAGRLGLGAANAIATTSQVVLAGGTLDTGGLAQDFTASAAPATLALNASSTLDLGGASNPTSVKLANSSAVAWTGTLTVAGWTYGVDHLSIGASASGLTSAQRGQITFSHFLPGAVISSTGELTPHPYDINQDTHVNVADVSAAMAGLTNVNGYISAHPGFTLSDATFLLDVNGDGQATNTDVQAMIIVLANGGGGSLSAVPEPASWLLLSLGGIAVCTRGIRRGCRRSDHCRG